MGGSVGGADFVLLINKNVILMSSTQTPHAAADVIIANKLGMHARPAMAFVDTANSYQSVIKIANGSQTADGKSIFQVMMLGATKGTKLQITAEGPDATEAITALTQLVDDKFGEE